MYFTQEDDEKLVWQEKTTSSSMAHSTSSCEQAVNTIGPRLEVCAISCIYGTSKVFESQS